MENFFKSKLNIAIVAQIFLFFVFILLYRISVYFFAGAVFCLAGVVFVMGIKLSIKYFDLKKQPLNLEGLAPYQVKIAKRRRKTFLFETAFESVCLYSLAIILVVVNFNTYII